MHENVIKYKDGKEKQRKKEKKCIKQKRNGILNLCSQDNWVSGKVSTKKTEF